MTNVFTRPLPTLPHVGYLEDLQSFPDWLPLPAHITPDQHPIYAPTGIEGIAHHTQNLYRSESWDLDAGLYTLNAYFMGQWIETSVTLSEHILTLQQNIQIAPGHGVVLVELSQGESRWTVMIRALLPLLSEENETPPRFQIYKTLLQQKAHTLELDTQKHPPLPGNVSLQLRHGIQRSLFGIQQQPSVLDVTGQRVAISAEEAYGRLADLLLAHRPPYGRTLVYADGDLDLFDYFALQEVGRLLGIRNLHGSSSWGAEALATGQALLKTQVHHTLEDILSLSQPVFLFNGWNGLIHHPVAFEKLVEHPTAHIWIIDSLMQESAKYLLAQHPRCEVMLIRPGSEGILALCLARCLMENHGFSDSAPGFKDYAAVTQSSIFELDPMIAELVADPQDTEHLKEQILRLASALANPEQQAAHIPGNSLYQSGGTQAYCLWHNLLELVNKRYEWQSFDTRNEGQQITHFGPHRFFGNVPMSETGCQQAALRMGLPEDAYATLHTENVRPIQDFLSPSQGNQRELIICIGHGLEARWIRDHDQWYEKVRSTDAVLVVLDSMPGPFMQRHAALCLPLSPEMSQYQLRQEGCSRWYHDLPQKKAPKHTHSTATWLYRTMDVLTQALQHSTHIQKGHPDLARHQDYLSLRFSSQKLPYKETEICRQTLWERMQAYMEYQGVYETPWEALFTETTVALEPPPSGIFHYFAPQLNDFSQPREPVLNIGSSVPNASFQQVRHAINASTRGHAYDYGTMPKERVLFISPLLAEQQGLSNGNRVELGQTGVSPIQCQVAISHDLKDKTLYFSHYLSQEELNTRQVMPWSRFRAQICPYSQVPLLKKVQVECNPLISKEPSHA